MITADYLKEQTFAFNAGFAIDPCGIPLACAL